MMFYIVIYRSYNNVDIRNTYIRLLGAMVFKKDLLMKLIIGFTTFLILLSCESKKITYSLLFADNASMVMDNQEIAEANFKGLNENGTWGHEINQVVYSKGTWENGLKKGIWKYNTGEREFHIAYADYKDAVSNFQISIKSTGESMRNWTPLRCSQSAIKQRTVIEGQNYL